MAQLNFKRVGPLALHDTGIPAQGKNYTTLFLIHGFAWHGGVFSRLIPFVEQQNCRLVLINRRDYPGSAPLTEEERKPLDTSLSSEKNAPEAILDLLTYTKARAMELHDVLSTFIRDAEIAEKSVVVAGWSFSSAWIIQLLAHVPKAESSLHKYLKRVVWYDPPYHALGYPPPVGEYNPLTDPSLAPGEGIKHFPAWVSGYYAHGDLSSGLEFRTPLQDPPPTILTMSPTDLELALFPGPGSSGGSDDVLLHAGLKHGLWPILRERALSVSSPPSDASKSETENIRCWNELELRYVWCDQSVWELPWATWSIQEELREAQQTGREVRKVTLMRLNGANHFVHWDQPERALRALLSDAPRECRKTAYGK